METETMTAGNSTPNGSEKHVETAMYKKLYQVFEIARTRKFLNLIFGKTGYGKSYAADRWARDHEGQCAYITCRSKITYGKLIRQTLKAVTGTQKSYLSTADKQDAIFDYLAAHPEHVLIFDEVNHILRNNSSIATADMLDFIRGVHDETKCGIVLIMTNYTLEELKHGPLGSFLEQIRGRMGYHLQAPPEISKKKDIIPALSAYTKNLTDELVNVAYDISIASEGNLRTLYKYLTLSKEYVETHGGQINAKLLKALRKHYETGGDWAETAESNQ